MRIPVWNQSNSQPFRHIYCIADPLTISVIVATICGSHVTKTKKGVGLHLSILLHVEISELSFLILQCWNFKCIALQLNFSNFRLSIGCLLSKLHTQFVQLNFTNTVHFVNKAKRGCNNCVWQCTVLWNHTYLVWLLLDTCLHHMISQAKYYQINITIVLITIFLILRPSSVSR